MKFFFRIRVAIPTGCCQLIKPSCATISQRKNMDLCKFVETFDLGLKLY